MRIAQVAPLYEAVPPKLYGGTERVVSYLTEQMVAMGHEVTLFASGDSATSAELVPVAARALRLAGDGGNQVVANPVIAHLLQMEAVMEQAARFDIVHVHCDLLYHPFARRSPVPVVTTLHGRQDLPGLAELYREYDDIPLVSISDAQRRPLPWVNWVATIHHGLPPGLLEPGRGDGGYLAFLGRFSAEKGFERAVEIARRTGIPLKAAAKFEPLNKDYFDAVVVPLLADPLVEWVGEIGEADKSAFLGGALAHLFPIDWPEPFGLVMLEAMACGTPTIAWPCGSVPEVVEDGVTGFVVDGLDRAVAAVERARGFDRTACRAAFEARFTARRMALDHLALYGRLAAIRHRSSVRPVAGGLMP